MKDAQTLAGLLLRLEAAIPDCEKKSTAVSQGSVGWHVEHSLLVLEGITRLLAQSDPQEYQWTFNFRRVFVLLGKKIPRGRAQSPESVKPKQEPTETALRAHLAQTQTALVPLQSIPENHFFKHPFLGNLPKKQALLFLFIHTRHHLLIIRDILGKKQ